MTHLLSTKQLLSCLLVALVCVVGFRAFASSQAVHVKWLIAHEPTDVFARAERAFADELARESNGRFSVEMLTPKDVGYEHDVPPAVVHRMMDAGEIQLATVPAVDLAGTDPQMLAFTLPFLFESYETSEKMLQSPLAEEMLAGVSENSSAHGLAFTFSGGFLIIPTRDTEIASPADMRGLKIGTTHGPIEDETVRALGGTPVTISLDEQRSALESGEVDGIIATYTRMPQWLNEKVHYINETDHALFLTTLLASDAFYQELSQKDADMIRAAAHNAAAIERADSIALAAKNSDIAKAQGVMIQELSATGREQFIAATAGVYEQFTNIFSEDFVQSVRTAQE